MYVCLCVQILCSRFERGARVMSVRDLCVHLSDTHRALHIFPTQRSVHPIGAITLKLLNKDYVRLIWDLQVRSSCSE